MIKSFILSLALVFPLGAKAQAFINGQPEINQFGFQVPLACLYKALLPKFLKMGDEKTREENLLYAKFALAQGVCQIDTQSGFLVVAKAPLEVEEELTMENGSKMFVIKGLIDNTVPVYTVITKRMLVEAREVLDEANSSSSI